MKRNISNAGRVSFMWPAKYLYFLLAFLVTVFIMIKSIDYLYPDFTRGFLIGKNAIFPVYRFFLYAHILGAPLAMLMGLYQFSFTRSKIHALIGKIYIISILALAAPGGFYMGFYAIGGWPSIINFTVLAILWWWFTFKAYQLARHRHWERHRRFMIRSFILTNSAILIRLLSFIHNQLQLIDLTTAYILIGWLSWLPGLMFFEFYLASKRFF